MRIRAAQARDKSHEDAERERMGRDDVGSATLVSVQAYVGIRPQDTLARIWPDLSTHPTDAGIAHELSVTTKNMNGVIPPASKTGEGRSVASTSPGPPQKTSSYGVRIAPRSSFWAERATVNPGQKRATTTGERERRVKARVGSSADRAASRAAAEALGLGSGLRPYDLRHTFATLAANAGWTEDEIATSWATALRWCCAPARAGAAVDQRLHS